VRQTLPITQIALTMFYLISAATLMGIAERCGVLRVNNIYGFMVCMSFG
jgi:hypothetical protein